MSGLNPLPSLSPILDDRNISLLWVQGRHLLHESFTSCFQGRKGAFKMLCYICSLFSVFSSKSSMCSCHIVGCCLLLTVELCLCFWAFKAPLWCQLNQFSTQQLLVPVCCLAHYFCVFCWLLLESEIYESKNTVSPVESLLGQSSVCLLLGLINTCGREGCISSPLWAHQRQELCLYYSFLYPWCLTWCCGLNIRSPKCIC